MKRPTGVQDLEWNMNYNINRYSTDILGQGKDPQVFGWELEWNMNYNINRCSTDTLGHGKSQYYVFN